jgi:lipopolysaccharide biosynthesis protein
MNFSTPHSHRDNSPRTIAFYLPQYHPIPENDEWWGKGFTEWTNVAKAKPLFKGHQQPNLPADLGFYDLRVPEVREAQAELARSHGIEGFCYWHYWFGNGKRLLERPFDEVLASGKPDYPFCLAWANQTWSGIWHGAPHRILIEQQYPGRDDWYQHFSSVLPAFQDSRYLKVNGKPIFVIYDPETLKDSRQFVDCWQELAHENGLDGIYFVGITVGPLNTDTKGLDGVTSHPPGDLMRETDAVINISPRGLFGKTEDQPKVYDYAKVTKIEGYEYLGRISGGLRVFPCVIPNWDNTPRSGVNGVVFKNSTPELFGRNLEKAVKFIENYGKEERIIFIKSWNEWAEGNYLEPDAIHGTDYLKVIKSILQP